MEDDYIMNKKDNDYCYYQTVSRDCDGDCDTYCMKFGSCEYQRRVRDCDGDIIVMCRL